MPRSLHGGRHELGQNFLHHRPTLERIALLVASTSGSILEIGAGGGALTGALGVLGRPLTAIDIDEHRVRKLRGKFPGVDVVHADAMTYPLDAAVIVGNVPFHLTTPLLRRILSETRWNHAILLVQWEVARKRAGVGGSTMMTAQSAPWYVFHLEGRVGRECFTPMPSVDGGILRIERRRAPLLPPADEPGYASFARAMFTGPGGSLHRILARTARMNQHRALGIVRKAGIRPSALPRDLTPEQWVALWYAAGRKGSPRRG
ncbi:23S ribosomal RNA methyltransferase Erm [Actinomycetaceae bacterium L2_0104]